MTFLDWTEVCFDSTNREYYFADLADGSVQVSVWSVLHLLISSASLTNRILKNC